MMTRNVSVERPAPWRRWRPWPGGLTAAGLMALALAAPAWPAAAHGEAAGILLHIKGSGGGWTISCRWRDGDGVDRRLADRRAGADDEQTFSLADVQSGRCAVRSGHRTRLRIRAEMADQAEHCPLRDVAGERLEGACGYDVGPGMRAMLALIRS